MVVKSHGPRRRTRAKLRGGLKLTVNRYVSDFPIGSKVVLVTDPASHRGMPFRRFYGLTGTVMEKRGRSFIVQIKDSNKLKKIAVRPEHLKAL
ncbi:MAG: 50S ribosomal protein L21e [Candidatus Aenigmatarchaeota archaeon]